MTTVHWMPCFLGAWAPWENGPGSSSLMGSGGLSWGLCTYRVLNGDCGRVVARALVILPPKCDMQKLTVDELKRLLYDTFCEHLSMKDIENIIMTEEESHMGTAEECPVDVESEWPVLGLCGWVPVLEQGDVPGVCMGSPLLAPSLVSLFALSQVHVPKCRPDSILSLSPSVFAWCSWWAATACSNQQIRQTCVRKSLICAFAIAFIISVMLIAANQVLRSGMK